MSYLWEPGTDRSDLGEPTGREVISREVIGETFGASNLRERLTNGGGAELRLLPDVVGRTVNARSDAVVRKVRDAV